MFREPTEEASVAQEEVGVGRQRGRGRGQRGRQEPDHAGLWTRKSWDSCEQVSEVVEHYFYHILLIQVSPKLRGGGIDFAFQ